MNIPLLFFPFCFHGLIFFAHNFAYRFQCGCEARRMSSSVLSVAQYFLNKDFWQIDAVENSF